MAVFLRPSRRRARPLPVRWGWAVRVVLLLAALLHGQYPALRAATGACTRGTLAVVVRAAAPAGAEASGTPSAVAPADGTETAGDALPGAATDPCASPYALARPTQRLARPGGAITLAPANLAVQAPPSHRSAPPLQPPRPS